MPSRSWLALALLLVSAETLAHKLQVFAFADGARIEGSAYLAGGGAATGARISILDPAGKVLAEPVPDGEGNFSYQAQAPADHLVVAETGEGHRAQWRVSAAELAAAFPGTAVPTGAPAPGPGPAAAQARATVGTDEALLALIEQAVGRQIGPLRRELMAAQERARLRDILGGIGYILGVAGLAVWWRSRRAGDRP